MLYQGAPRQGVRTVGGPGEAGSGEEGRGKVYRVKSLTRPSSGRITTRRKASTLIGKKETADAGRMEFSFGENVRDGTAIRQVAGAHLAYRLVSKTSPLKKMQDFNVIIDFIS